MQLPYKGQECFRWLKLMKYYDDDGNYEDPDDDRDIEVEDLDRMTEPGQFSSNDKREGVGGKQGRAHQDLREEGVQLANLWNKNDSGDDCNRGDDDNGDHEDDDERSKLNMIIDHPLGKKNLACNTSQIFLSV